MDTTALSTLSLGLSTFISSTLSIFLLSLLTFLIIFDPLSYLKYLFKYVILYVVFKLYLVIKQSIIKYIIIFNFFNNTNGQT
jgi:hypothetical protein